ncbi:MULTISPECIES: hypothetical protein [unclassified Shewanella]|uniref:hypothetical protein n=1 Tax=unclassified Shewanella TaxID=196818 RepID=UPI001BC79BC6|nr:MULTISPECIES: hypothetical protein [unclassified Shewanella]GIU11927.1 hypothetical protein TUM4444_18680 [Shewanella sp. MBTL60-112-B1]GIU31894.1 hypothetical protein TUM4445_16930 [Shewanella sp. MBTL60-112-B2]
MQLSKHKSQDRVVSASCAHNRQGLKQSPKQEAKQEPNESGISTHKEAIVEEPKESDKATSTGWGLYDILEMQTEFALCQSMARSKTLTVMVCLGALAYGGFILFLLKMAA